MDNKEYEVWSSSIPLSNVVTATSPEKALDAALKENDIKCLGYMRVYLGVAITNLENVRVREISNNETYLFYLDIEAPEDEAYFVDFSKYINKNKVEHYLCITKYDGDPLDLVSELLGIDRDHINPTLSGDASANINLMSLKTGKKYAYVTSPWTPGGLLDCLNKTEEEIDNDVKDFIEKERLSMIEHIKATKGEKK